MRLAIVSAVLVNLLTAVAARAAIYCWYDPQGVTHYVDDLAKVPAAYRDQIVTFVTDLPLLVPAASEASPPPPAPVAGSTAAVTTQPEPQRTESSFEAGYWAGMAAAHVAAPPEPAPAPLGPIVQNVQIFEAAPQIPSFVVVGPAFIPRAIPPLPRRFPPSVGDRFLRGPAGPPPIGAAGPPPVFGGRP